MSLANIPDYLTLYKSDANVEANKYTWNLPSNYFTNCRGNKCYISLSHCIITSDAPTSHEALILRYDGGLNANTSNKGSNVIGLINVVSTNENNDNVLFTSSTSPENIKLLIPARPPTITLSTFSPDNTSALIDDAVFVLRFDYLEQSDDYTNTFYNKLK